MLPREREWNCTYTFTPLSLHFCCTSVPALRRPVRPSLAGEPDVMRRTVSPRCSTANSRRPRTAAPIWWPSATIHPSPLPGFCGTRRTGRRIRGPDSLPSPLRVFDLPVSSRVRQPVWFCGWLPRCSPAPAVSLGPLAEAIWLSITATLLRLTISETVSPASFDVVASRRTCARA